MRLSVVEVVVLSFQGSLCKHADPRRSSRKGWVVAAVVAVVAVVVAVAASAVAIHPHPLMYPHLGRHSLRSKVGFWE